ncbi:sialate:O-sulfotransferase 2-like [Mytilus trossulus]|uniref:sialate:O-sulfotransferase 2-like n=1 Tax=Mytilus trossulus TaxID=6551 RepID=UPI0030056707
MISESVSTTMRITLLLLICSLTIVNVDAFDFMRMGHYLGYVGCYVDKSQRLLARFAGEGNMSLGKCRHLCRGYRYLGLQYGKQCLCGNYLNHRAYPQSSELQCNMVCTSEPHRMCGGPWRNSIYRV